MVLIIDQITKLLVVHKMQLGDSIPLIEGYFYLTSHRNAGAAFGILQGQRLFFILITIIVVVGLIYYLNKLKNDKPVLAVSLSLILGGALGNFVDRLRLGEVIDFLDVKINFGSFYYDYPIFNVADSALVIGVFILLIDSLVDGWKEAKDKKRKGAGQMENE